MTITKHNTIKFRKAIHFLFEAEGGLSDDTQDRGGLTKYGISQKSYPNIDISNLTKEHAVAIYYEDYWNPLHCYKYDEQLAIVLFDTSVNCGIGSASQWLQRVCNKKGSSLKVDGIIGSKTRAEVYKYNYHSVVNGIICYRLKHYSRIVHKDSTQKKFLRGWVERVANLLFYVL